jgi:hypothetical protein
MKRIIITGKEKKNTQSYGKAKGNKRGRPPKKEIPTKKEPVVYPNRGRVAIKSEFLSHPTSTIPAPTKELNRVPHTKNEAVTDNHNENKSYNFEQFTRGGLQKYQFHLKPFISVYKNGVISLSTTFVREEKKISTKFDFTKLYYDRDSQTLGIQFTNDSKFSDLFRLTIDKDSCRSFSAKSFFYHYGLDLNQFSGQYEAKREYINKGIGEIWVVSLKKQSGILQNSLKDKEK